MTKPLLELLERASLDALAERFRSDEETNLPALFPLETLALLRAISNEAPLDTLDADDVERPVVVVVHGILGGHLAERSDPSARIWCHAGRTVTGSVARRLALADASWARPHEESDVVPERAPLYLAYGPAITAWQLCGMHVETITYDWRRDVRDEARRFGDQVRALRAKHGRPMILVAHSMGGLVASAWAQRSDADLDAFSRVAFVAVPLGGSFDAVAAHLGEPWLMHALGAASIDETFDDVRAMASSWPGLVQLFPHGAVLDAHLVDDETCWEPGRAPRALLRTMRDALHDTLFDSPLVQRAVRFYSSWYPTKTGVERASNGRLRIGGYGAGDFVVPLASLRAGGDAPTLRTTVWHPQTVVDPVVIAKVLSWGYDSAAALVGAAVDEQASATPEEVTPDHDARFASMRPPQLDAPATAADEAILTR
ncbi:esterase/lipase family protein [Sandaracinus amylolyticus]|uniref:Uncharacterized protein n=1 Tax=Sandaracinus amylolyticus TaxID=927083 RepID=A0A0F6W9L5_9BACT|nr:hypothetical protein [Sandaracinus amylolyticus]AKF10956.1 Hypothetical protein DB32_008105 [Sandaracinus amylolyticus]